MRGGCDIVFADVLAPYDYTKANPADRLQGASVQHPLGTDQLGRDLLSRLLYGARISLIVGLAATAITVAVAVLVGGASGFVGGRLDLMVQRVVDAWMAFPGLLLLLTVMSIVGRGMLQIIVVLGISGGIPASRIVRGAVIGVKESAYFSGGRVHWPQEVGDARAPRAAQYRGSGNRRFQHQHRSGDHR